MEELQNLEIHSELLNVINKMTCSMLEIKQKHPTRIDLITSLDESINSLKKVSLNRFKMQNEIEYLRKLNLEWSLKCLKIEQKLKELEDKSKVDTVNLDYITQLEKENKELNNKIELLITNL